MTRILHVNHTAVVGGAERSLLALLEHTSGERIAGVCCPPGPLAKEVSARGISWFSIVEPEARFDASAAERIGAVARLARTGPTIDVVARRTAADLIHANSIRTTLAATVSRRSLVTHVRDLLPANATGRLVKHAVVARSARIVGISDFVARNFAADVARPGRWDIVDNPIDLRRLPMRNLAHRTAMRRGLGLDDVTPLALVIGQLTPWKRQHLAIAAVRGARSRGVALQLGIVGSVKFATGRTGEMNRQYERRLHKQVDELGLRDAVTFFGERDDVAHLLGGADVVLIPSENEPFGRVAVEAIACGVPVLASPAGGPAAVVARYGGGFAVPRDEPHHWAEALVRMLSDAAENAVGVPSDAALAVRQAFDASRHAARMAAVFDRVAAGE